MARIKNLSREIEFLFNNWLTNPCGHRRSKKKCGNCPNWKAPVKDDHKFSPCYMNERTRRLITELELLWVPPKVPK